LRRLGLVLALLVVWQLAALRGLPDYLLSPLDIGRNFITALGTSELYVDAWASLMRAIPGFLIGTAAGVALGLAAGIWKSFDEMLSPLVFLSYPVPKIVMLPVFMLWFGIGDVSKVLIIALACFYPSFINAFYGARATPRILVWSARNMGASGAQIFRRVVLPAALPSIFTGVYLALLYSWLATLGAEYLLTSGAGIGNLLVDGRERFWMDLVLFGVIVVGLVGFSLNWIASRLEARVLAWRGRSVAQF